MGCLIVWAPASSPGLGETGQSLPYKQRDAAMASLHVRPASGTRWIRPLVDEGRLGDRIRKRRAVAEVDRAAVIAAESPGARLAGADGVGAHPIHGFGRGRRTVAPAR